VLDFELCRWLRPEEVEERLGEEIPEGIALKSLKSVPTKPDRRPTFFSYRIPLREGHPVTPRLIERVLEADELIVERKKKRKVKKRDIAGFVRVIRLEKQNLHMLLAMTDRGTARPEEVLRSLGCRPGRDYLKSAITRTHVDLSASL
jgi:radical SAM-linked protein